ncbi:hypothetical protein [Streptomyces sp. R33]|uniref:Uncharacterized protein n=1 Tax=Streptomyces sp. R33 TaxID=3238629 RepID=A0AB39Y2D5_9ACTN
MQPARGQAAPEEDEQQVLGCAVDGPAGPAARELLEQLRTRFAPAAAPAAGSVGPGSGGP